MRNRRDWRGGKCLLFVAGVRWLQHEALNHHEIREGLSEWLYMCPCKGLEIGVFASEPTICCFRVWGRWHGPFGLYHLGPVHDRAA